VDDILAFARRRPPFVSVYLTADTATEDGHRRLAADWRNHRDELRRQGAAEELLAPVDGVVATHRPTGGLAVLVDGDSAVLARPLPEPPRVEQAHVGPLPRLAPLIEVAQRLAPHVISLVDRTGADIVAVVDGEREDVGHVVGDTEAIQKVQAGGWSHRRYQQRAENTWERNATGVAQEVADVAHAIGAQLVVAAGDERAVGFLQDHLPEDVKPLLHVSAHGGRAAGVDGELLDEEIGHLVASLGAERVVAELQAFGELRGRHGSLADGPGETFTALRQALVATLLIHDDPADERTAWFSPTAPTMVALEARTLRDLGVEPLEERLVDVAVWSAAGSGGTVVIVPAHGRHVPLDAVGARLRAEVDLRAAPA
jgi:hypothetical protein